MNIISLILTLGVGLFILIGTLLVFFTKNNKNFIDFSISLAFGVMITLGVLELLPESYELINETFNRTNTILLLIGFIIIGIIILKSLDLFVPHHHDDEDHHNKAVGLFHIGIMTIIACFIHNIIEGMAIYNITTKNLEAGLLMTLGVGLHNIPLGMVITSIFYESTKSKHKTILISLFISLTTFIGGLLMFITKGITPLTEGILLSITLGMIIYITFFELLPEIKEIQNKKLSILGILSGIIILIISLFI